MQVINNLKSKKTKKSFNKLYKKSKCFVTNSLIIRFNANITSNFNFNISISKKIFKKAVIRNKIKRQIRALSRYYEDKLKVFNLLFIVKNTYDYKEFDNIKNEFKFFIKKNLGDTNYNVSRNHC